MESQHFSDHVEAGLSLPFPKCFIIFADRKVIGLTMIEKLKAEIIDVLNLEGLSPSDIADDQPLFGTSLGLDSIDALELIVLLERNYGVKVVNADEGKEIFESVNSMARYIESKSA